MAGGTNLRMGVPILARGYLTWLGVYPPWPGKPPPPGVNRLTPVKTVPSHRITYAGGNNANEILYLQVVLKFQRDQQLDC